MKQDLKNALETAKQVQENLFNIFEKEIVSLMKENGIEKLDSRNSKIGSCYFTFAWDDSVGGQTCIRELSINENDELILSFYTAWGDVESKFSSLANSIEKMGFSETTFVHRNNFEIEFLEQVYKAVEKYIEKNKK